MAAIDFPSNPTAYPVESPWTDPLGNRWYYTASKLKWALLGVTNIIDNTVIDGSTNPVSGNAVFDAIAAKNALSTPFTPVGSIAATNVQAAIAELDAKKAAVINYVFEGDSIFTPDWDAINTPTMGFNTSVPTQFLKYHNSKSGVVTNHAVSGQTVSAMISQYATQARLQSPIVTGIPAWFILDGGINDISQGATPAAIYANIKTLWAAAKADGYMVCATTQQGWTTDPTYELKRNQLNSLVLSDKNLFDAVARFDAVLVGYRADQYFDSVHGNEIGRKILAKSISQAIRGRREEVLGYTSAIGATSPGTIPALSEAAVALNTNSDSGGSWVSGNSHVCKRKGHYLVTANVVIATVGTLNAGNTFLGRIYVNSVARLRTYQISGLTGSSVPLSICGSGIVDCDVGDIIQYKIQSDIGMSVASNTESSWMQVFMLPQEESLTD